MINRLEITVIVDNNSKDEKLHTEHGLSLWIEADDRRILFDAGQSNLVIENAMKLGIDLSTADSFIISHGHYDHTGGIPELLKINPSIDIYCHPSAFLPRYSRQADGRMKVVGINRNSSYVLNQVVEKIKWVNRPKKLTDDITVAGFIPRRSSFEDTGGAFYLDFEGNKPDPINDDTSIWFRTDKGLCIVTGCCHSGIVNTISYVKSIEKDLSVHTVLGGLHLVNASAERINKTCDFLDTDGVCQIVPLHCTGENAVMYMQKRLEKKIVAGEAGLKIVI